METTGTVTAASPDTSAALLEELARAYEETHLLHGLAATLQDEIDHRMVFLRIMTCLKELFPVEAAQVWIPSKDRDEYTCVLNYDGSTMCHSNAAVPFDRALEPHLPRSGVYVLRQDGEGAAVGPAESPRMEANGEPQTAFFRLLSSEMGVPAVVAPLLSKTKLLGFLVLRLPPAVENLDASRLRLVAAAARQTSVSLHLFILFEELRQNEGLRREIEIARRIQRDLLPESIPESPAYDLFAGCITAAHVGGDYYDLLRFDEDKLGILVADVSGHSVGSALIAMSFRSAFHFCHAQERDPGLLFEKVHAAIFSELRRSGTFLSAFYGVFDEKTRRFRYVNAGHHPPLLWRSSTRQFAELSESGLLIGVLPTQEYRTGEVQLTPGDILLVYTDGIVEAENQQGKLFGVERLKKALGKSFSRGCRGVYHGLLKEMYIFQDEQFNKDDVTLVVLRVLEDGGK